MRNSKLWQSIDNFQLDDKNSEFTFTQRLARDNRWSVEFSRRVISEYKKFIYLCCVGYGEITPSDAVDQAWHLHLTYTKSYWIDLCRDTLGKQIHHNPTAGGVQEKEKYSGCYDSILTVYEKEFSEKAPGDIWPTNEERFGNIDYKRINLSEFWLVKKPNFNRSTLALLLLPGLGMLFIRSDNPVPWGSLFLVVIFIILIARTVKGGGKKGKRRGGSDSGCSFWGGFWGCSSDDGHSGCSSHGCSSGCSGCSGCGGGD